MKEKNMYNNGYLIKNTAIVNTFICRNKEQNNLYSIHSIQGNIKMKKS